MRLTGTIVPDVGASTVVMPAACGLAACGLALALGGHPALADTTPSSTISITATGSVTFSPDIAHVSVGVRGEASSAEAAAKSVNARARAVVDAMHKLGMVDRDITTTGYSVQYQPPERPEPSPLMNTGTAPMPIGQAGFPGEKRKPIPGAGTYVASETLEFRTAIEKAGAALDAAMGAGANEANGIWFDTSARDALYRQALGRAVAAARAQADVLAKAAGVSIAGVVSLSVGETPGPMPRMMAMAEAAPGPPVMGGTGTVDATVQVVYRIK